VKDCENLHNEHKIHTRGGRRFGSDARNVRISMMSRVKTSTFLWRGLWIFKDLQIENKTFMHESLLRDIILSFSFCSNETLIFDVWNSGIIFLIDTTSLINAKKLFDFCDIRCEMFILQLTQVCVEVCYIWIIFRIVLLSNIK